MIEFWEVDGESAVYAVESDGPLHPISLPAKAKSRFCEARDVSYDDCRAKIVERDGETFVLVGEVA